MLLKCSGQNYNKILSTVAFNQVFSPCLFDLASTQKTSFNSALKLSVRSQCSISLTATESLGIIHGEVQLVGPEALHEEKSGIGLRGNKWD